MTLAASDAWPLICPVCGRGLGRRERALACAVGHSFDLAREGYVNLLHGSSRKRIPGDSAAMLQARRRFLGGGHFAPLREHLRARVADALASAGEGPRCVLEVGCGEGYYIGGIAGALAPQAAQTRFVAMDLAKPAAKLAARRSPQLLVFIGDVHRGLSVAEGSVTVLLDLFAPRNAAAFARAVAPGGRLLVVVPAPTHLASLRREFGLLAIHGDKQRQLLTALADDFAVVDQTQLELELELDGAALADLVAMGPNHWHRRGAAELPREGRRTQACLVVFEFVRRGR